MHAAVYVSMFRVRARGTLSPPPGILMKRRPLQTCDACDACDACPATAHAHSGQNFDINDLCCICIQT